MKIIFFTDLLLELNGNGKSHVNVGGSTFYFKLQAALSNCCSEGHLLCPNNNCIVKQLVVFQGTYQANNRLTPK